MPAFLNKWLSAFMRVFFRLLYHQFAWSYDIVSGIVSLGMWNDWIRTIEEDLTGPRVLELGHGPGHLQVALQKGNSMVFGIDQSPQMSRLATGRLRRRNFDPRFTNASSQRLPFPANTFDQIGSTFPTEYIIDPLTIQEIHRTLKPGGKAVIIPMAWITGKGALYKAAAWLFQVTGQAGEIEDSVYAKGLAEYGKQGFSVELEEREQTYSTVLVFHATKRER
jgi:ubiquinone/menaquinone biosynthesis C-methylase UbiE